MDILAALAGGPAPAGQGRPARPAGSAGPDGAGGTGDGAAQTRGFAQDLAALSGEPDGAEGREKGAPDMPTGREMAGEDAVDAQDAALPDTSRKSIAEGGAPALPGPASAPIPEMVRATADAHGPAVRVAVPAVSTPPAGTGGESAAGVAPPAAREVGPGGAGPKGAAAHAGPAATPDATGAARDGIDPRPPLPSASGGAGGGAVDPRAAGTGDATVAMAQRVAPGSAPAGLPGPPAPTQAADAGRDAAIPGAARPASSADRHGGTVAVPALPGAGTPTVSGQTAAVPPPAAVVPAAAAGPPVGAGAQSAGPDHPAPPAPMRQTPGMGVAVRRVLTGEEARTLSGADGRFAPATPAPPRRAHASAPSAGQEPRLPRPGAAPATVAFGWDAPSRPAGPLSLSAEQLQSRLPSANSGRAAPDAAATSPRQPSLPEGGDPSRMSAVSRMRASIQVRPVPDGAIGDAQISPPPKRGDMQSLVARVVDRQTGPRPAPSPAAASVPLAASPGPQGDGTRAAVSVRPALAALSAPAQAGQDLSGPAGTRGVGAAAGAGMPGQLAAEHAVPGDPPTRHPLVSASSGVVAGQSAAAAQAGAPTLDAAEPMPVPEQRAPVAPAAQPSGDLAEGALRAGSSPVGGGQAPGQSGVASSAAQTSAASASAASSGAEAARAVLPQVAAAIRAVPGSASFDLQLDPPELGRVRIGLDITDSGLRASLMAERPATGELLRANGAVLAQQLQDAGFSEIDLDFGAPQQDRRDTREREMARSRGAASGSAVSADASSAYAASAIGEEGIDLRF